VAAAVTPPGAGKAPEGGRTGAGAALLEGSPGCFDGGPDGAPGGAVKAPEAGRPEGLAGEGKLPDARTGTGVPDAADPGATPPSLDVTVAGLGKTPEPRVGADTPAAGSDAGGTAAVPGTPTPGAGKVPVGRLEACGEREGKAPPVPCAAGAGKEPEARTFGAFPCPAPKLPGVAVPVVTPGLEKEPDGRTTALPGARACPSFWTGEGKVPEDRTAGTPPPGLPSGPRVCGKGAEPGRLRVAPLPPNGTGEVAGTFSGDFRA